MLSDIRYALRTLRKSPGFALVAIISLALGIGANSAVFSLANGLLLRPLAVPHAGQLISVQSQLRGESLGGLTNYSQLSYPDYIDLKARNKSFAGLTAAQFFSVGFALDQKTTPQMKFGMLVSGDFFRVLQVQPSMGRDFRPDEDQVKGRDAVVVLSYDMWKKEFEGSPDAIGRKIILSGLDFTVIGVSPREFHGVHPLLRTALYIPMAMGPRLAAQADMLEQRGSRPLFVLGRLRDGVSVAQASAETAVIGQQLARAYPETNKTCSLTMAPEVQARMRQDPMDTMLIGILLALSVVVLLIACANVANLMLSRARGRAREIAVRLAIGAGRMRLVRQLLAESLVLALTGGALGLLLAQAGADLFSQIPVPVDLPIVFDIRIDPRVLLFALVSSLFCAVLFGLAPALSSTNPQLTPALKASRSDDLKRRRFLGRNALVIGQVAGSLLLLVFATQAYRGAAIVLESPVGFRTDHILTANFDPSLLRYTPEQAREFYKKLLDGARALPGVRDAALAQGIPMLPVGDASRVIPEGVQLPPGAEAISVLSSSVTPEYFGVINIPIVSGRGFQAIDKADSPRVAIVNELFARKYYPNKSPLGRRFRLNSASGPLVQIVGVAKQSKYLFAVEPPIEYIYQPLAQNPQNAMSLMLFTTIAPVELTSPVRSLVRSLDASQPIIGMRTMDEVFEQRARKTMSIIIDAIAALGVLGLVLALVGLYGLMTYSVGLRQREIGIRMALGAGQGGVLGMILRQGLALAGTGVAVGLALWLLASGPVMAFVQAHSFSWSLLAVVSMGLLGAAGLGAYIPARRASRMDPNAVLRQD